MDASSCWISSLREALHSRKYIVSVGWGIDWGDGTSADLQSGWQDPPGQYNLSIDVASCVFLVSGPSGHASKSGL